MIILNLYSAQVYTKMRNVIGGHIFFGICCFVFLEFLPVTWQAVRPSRTQVRNLINSGSGTVGLGGQI